MKQLKILLVVLALSFMSGLHAQAFRPTGPLGDEAQFTRRAIQASSVDYVYLENYLRTESLKTIRSNLRQQGINLPDKDLQPIVMFLSQDILREIALGRYNRTQSRSNQIFRFNHCMAVDPHLCDELDIPAAY